MGNWSEYDFAARFRDKMIDLVRSVLDDLRPPPRYAEVKSIDKDTNVAVVRFLGEDDDIPVAMASIQPSRAGQIVRVNGMSGDRYIDDVLGESVISGGIPIGMMFDWGGATIPPWARKADGSLLSTTDYPALFAEYQYRHGGSGDQFALPSQSTTNQNVVTLVRVR